MEKIQLYNKLLQAIYNDLALDLATQVEIDKLSSADKGHMRNCLYDSFLEPGELNRRDPSLEEIKLINKINKLFPL